MSAQFVAALCSRTFADLCARICHGHRSLLLSTIPKKLRKPAFEEEKTGMKNSASQKIQSPYQLINLKIEDLMVRIRLLMPVPDIEIASLRSQ
jgi:hypothetical protein